MSSHTIRPSGRWATMASVALFVAGPLAAQKSVPAPPFDRSVVPPAGPSPKPLIPTWTTTTLPNGAELVVVERHALPLILFSINFVGGSDQFEPADKTGLASLVTGLLSDGTTTRSGDSLSNAIQSLGISITSSIGAESGVMSFTSMKDKFQPALALLADEMLRPAYRAAAVDELRDRMLVTLRQSRDQTATVSLNVFLKTVYGSHPYGRVTTEATLRNVTRADVVAFHDAYYIPGRAIITVVGDITPTAARAAVQRALGAWTGDGSRPSFSYPAPPAPSPTTIYLVDKPGAAQSSFSIGCAGPPRTTADYVALRVMNSMLGELFQSRLNADIREAKGYSYGVRSSFDYGHGPGAFRASGDIRTNATDSALVEFMAQLRGIRDQPASVDELSAAKAALVQSLPSRLASVAGVNGLVTDVMLAGLPSNYYQGFISGVEAVTADDVARVAKKYVDPDHLVIVIVGDLSAIEAPVRATHIAPVVVLDSDGNLRGHATGSPPR